MSEALCACGVLPKIIKFNKLSIIDKYGNNKSVTYERAINERLKNYL